MTRYIIWVVIAISLGGLALILSSAEVGALIFTAIFIAWYSLETSKLVKETKIANQLSEKTRREMILANQISIQPVLVLEYKEGPPWFFNLKNIGRGSAININITANNQEFGFKLEGLSVMKDGDEKQVTLLRNSSNLNTEDWNSLGSSPIEATISFERTKKIQGKKAILKTKIEIKNPPETKIVETQWIPA